ncbi:MAG TPA: right-handed parallel beta-helix repeat-containing protein [Kofleriaceae bacterium]|nr:right-handed parallel beta-helix repeat-containing protein [Kofleriaceae bacterium]
MGWRWLIVTLAACYHGSAAFDQPCSADGKCPFGQVCDTGQSPPLCVAMLGDASIQQGGGDAAPADASPCGACPASMPVCDLQSTTCRACGSDSDCPSDLCVESTGECIDQARALYVDPSGSDSGDCERAAPCATVSYAVGQITQTRRAIRVGDGTYTDSFIGNAMGGTVLVSGSHADASAATFQFTADGGQFDHVFELRSGNWLFEDVTLTGAVHEALRVQGGATVTLFASKLTGSGGGLDIAASTVTATVVAVTGNNGIGVNANGSATVDLERCAIANNSAAGIQSSGASLTVVNTLIAGNSAGAVVAGPTAGGATLRFDFDTVADNGSASSPAGTGLTCSTGQVIPVTNSIFSNNGTAPQISNCPASYTLFSDTAATGDGNMQGDPLFVNESHGNFHITPDSPARSVADPGATLDIDFDGEARPQGPNRDMGCDEIP